MKKFVKNSLLIGGVGFGIFALKKLSEKIEIKHIEKDDDKKDVFEKLNKDLYLYKKYQDLKKTQNKNFAQIEHMVDLISLDPNLTFAEKFSALDLLLEKNNKSSSQISNFLNDEKNYIVEDETFLNSGKTLND